MAHTNRQCKQVLSYFINQFDVEVVFIYVIWPKVPKLIKTTVNALTQTAAGEAFKAL